MKHPKQKTAAKATANVHSRHVSFRLPAHIANRVDGEASLIGVSRAKHFTHLVELAYLTLEQKKQLRDALTLMLETQIATALEAKQPRQQPAHKKRKAT